MANGCASQFVIHANVRDSNECASRPMKSLARNQIFDRSVAAVHAHVEIQNLLPHGRKKTQMPLLPGVFLRDLQFDALVRFLQPAKKRRDRFAGLEIDRSILDLDDDVVIKLSVERMKDVVSCARPIIFRIAPIQMMVVNKRPIEEQSAMRAKRASNHIGGVGRRSAIG